MAVPWFLLFNFGSVATQGVVMASLRALELAPHDWGTSYLLGECAAIDRHNLWYDKITEAQQCEKSVGTSTVGEPQAENATSSTDDG